MLPEVGTRAGHDDAQLVGGVAGEFGGFGCAGQFDRTFRAADSAFAVGDQRKQGRLAAHPARRAQFGQRLGPVAAVIGRNADGLADCGDAAGPGAGSAGVLQRGLGVVVEEFACGDEMARHHVGSGPIQRCEFAPDLGRQLLGFDRRRNRWALGARCFAVWFGLGAAGTVRPRGARRRTPGTVPIAAALPVLDHVCLSTLICQLRQFENLELWIYGEYRITPHAICGG